MAADRRQTGTSRNTARSRGTSSGRTKTAVRKRKQKRRMVIFAIEIIVILLMIAVLYLVLNISDEGPKFTVLDPEELAIPSEIQQAKENGESAMQGYMNIALFGVDAMNENQIEKNSRTDSIIIASVNMDTGDIRLVSVYRDTYLNLGTDTYSKCNAAYAKGGPTQAIKMLNMNLDMDIESFVTVGYNALIDVINDLGGIYVEIKENEISHLNNYQKSIVAAWKYGVALTDDSPASVFDVVKSGDYTPVTEAGYQRLDGLQAAAYCRIRYVGNDYKRTERQRTVLKAIQDQAKKADISTLTDVFNSAIKQVYTNLTDDVLKERYGVTMLELLGKIADYRIADSTGFPQMDQLTTGDIANKGNCIVPLDLESNVVWLHQYLFGEENYQVTSTVRECSEEIKAQTASYLGN